MANISTVAGAFLLLTATMPGKDVRIGVFGLFQPERIHIKPVPGSVLRITAGARTVVLRPNEQAGLRAAAGEIDVFAQREQTTARTVAVTARDGGPAEVVLSVPGRIERRFHGMVQVTAAAGRLTAVLTLDSETAVAAAVAAEMPRDSPIEALKAMAVLARSYYLHARGRHRGFDFCDTTHCQFHRSPPEPSSPAARATAETSGWVLHRAAMYAASCGGKTVAAPDHPSVECPACLRDAPVWERRLPLSAAGSLLTQRHEAARLSVVRKLGWSAVPSNNFTIRAESDWVLLSGRGEGHGSGLCQLGAAAMAAAGVNFRAILSHYLPSLAITQQIP